MTALQLEEYTLSRLLAKIDDTKSTPSKIKFQYIGNQNYRKYFFVLSIASTSDNQSHQKKKKAKSILDKIGFQSLQWEHNTVRQGESRYYCYIDSVAMSVMK